MREIILDTETTGLDPKLGHKIIEIGAVELYNKVKTGEVFHYYINPQRDVPAEAFRIHGISTEFLKDKPLFSEISADFLSFINDGTLVIHNAKFDTNFLNYELSLLNLPSIDQSKVVDTLEIARRKFPGQRNSLDALCRRFKIDNSHRNYHGALLDAELLAEVYVEIMGGRQGSFKISSNNRKNIVISSFESANIVDFKIIYPTEDEILEHKKFVSKIQNNLWKYED